VSGVGGLSTYVQYFDSANTGNVGASASLVYDYDLNSLALRDGQLYIENSSTTAKETLTIEQADLNQPFITFESDSASNNIYDYDSYNVITANGNGAIDGPKRSGSTVSGWCYGGVFRIDVITGSTSLCANGTWIQGWILREAYSFET